MHYVCVYDYVYDHIYGYDYNYVSALHILDDNNDNDGGRPICINYDLLLNFGKRMWIVTIGVARVPE